MTAWDEYLKGLDDDTRQLANDWLATRPPMIQAAFKRFPPGTRLYKDGKALWMVGIKEGEDGEFAGLLVSNINPSDDYEGATQNTQFVCSDHFSGE
jgi:hypothetical protein